MYKTMDKEDFQRFVESFVSDNIWTLYAQYQDMRKRYYDCPMSIYMTVRAYPDESIKCSLPVLEMLDDNESL